ncbi:hypothetical protein DPMN_186770 [Dreissena polymorpha]|uniref:Uncharacterized protein n=1 Tax=Dreissena polymorpha TaxID=45954 RepID=A0A9D4DN78_DREPO|nr:hypothetical protein DPMN_186770 [Dreissena polymorpha]
MEMRFLLGKKLLDGLLAKFVGNCLSTGTRVFEEGAMGTVGTRGWLIANATDFFLCSVYGDSPTFPKFEKRQ